MDKQMQAASQPLRGRMFKRDDTRRKEERILVLKTGIAGMQYYVEGPEDQLRLDNLKPGDELRLYRDPDNEHDEWAVAVYATEEDKLGYISRFKNETIARLMDAGKKFVAVVDSPEEKALSAENDREGSKRRRRAATENMSLPFSVFLVEEA